jgi:hypothetical protein
MRTIAKILVAFSKKLELYIEKNYGKSLKQN